MPYQHDHFTKFLQREAYSYGWSSPHVVGSALITEHARLSFLFISSPGRGRRGTHPSSDVARSRQSGSVSRATFLRLSSDKHPQCRLRGAHCGHTSSGERVSGVCAEVLYLGQFVRGVKIALLMYDRVSISDPSEARGALTLALRECSHPACGVAEIIATRRNQAHPSSAPPSNLTYRLFLVPHALQCCFGPMQRGLSPNVSHACDLKTWEHSTYFLLVVRRIVEAINVRLVRTRQTDSLETPCLNRNTDRDRLTALGHRMLQTETGRETDSLGHLV